MDQEKALPRDGKRGKGPRGSGTPSAKLRGLPKDTPDVRTSKTVTWILRHGSVSEGLAMRPDGYVRVDELLALPKMRDMNFAALQEMVANDNKSRFHLLSEIAEGHDGGDSPLVVWWIRANQGHSMKTVELELQPINSVSDIPTGIAVHGTNKQAWEKIRSQGLHKMTRNHIHLAQGVAGSGVISGMRNTASIHIYVDVQKALDAGIQFFLSANGVVLTAGDADGYLQPRFFERVQTVSGKPMLDWKQSESGNGEKQSST